LLMCFLLFCVGFFFNNSVFTNIFYGILGSFIVAVFIDFSSTSRDNKNKEEKRDALLSLCRDKYLNFQYQAWNALLDSCGQIKGEESTVNGLLEILFTGYYKEKRIPLDLHEESLAAFMFYIKNVEETTEELLLYTEKSDVCQLSDDQKAGYDAIQRLSYMMNIHYQEYKRYLDDSLILGVSEEILDAINERSSENATVAGVLAKNSFVRLNRLLSLSKRLVDKIYKVIPEAEEQFVGEYVWL